VLRYCARANIGLPNATVDNATPSFAPCRLQLVHFTSLHKREVAVIVKGKARGRTLKTDLRSSTTMRIPCVKIPVACLQPCNRHFSSHPDRTRAGRWPGLCIRGAATGFPPAQRSSYFFAFGGTPIAAFLRLPCCCSLFSVFSRLARTTY
jgi:hypothetical protein